MTAQIIDGRAIASEFKAKMAELIKLKIASGHKQPGLAVILVGNDPASTIYVRNKREACEQIGIHSTYHHLPAKIGEEKLF